MKNSSAGFTDAHEWAFLARKSNESDFRIVDERAVAPHTCKHCGLPSWIDPSDQSPPPDYCHEIDHGMVGDRAALDSHSAKP